MPDSITLFRSHTWSQNWFSTNSCGSATSLRLFFRSKAGRRQVQAISTSSVRLGPRPGLPLIAKQNLVPAKSRELVADPQELVESQVCNQVCDWDSAMEFGLYRVSGSTTIEEFHARTKKSQIYSVGNFDLKFVVQEELMNQYWFLLYTRLLNIFCDTLSSQIRHKLTSLALDCFVVEMFPINIDRQ